MDFLIEPIEPPRIVIPSLPSRQLFNNVWWLDEDLTVPFRLCVKIVVVDVVKFAPIVPINKFEELPVCVLVEPFDFIDADILFVQIFCCEFFRVVFIKNCGLTAAVPEVPPETLLPQSASGEVIDDVLWIVGVDAPTPFVFWCWVAGMEEEEEV